MADKQNLQAKIIKMAWENEGFKKELLVNPKKAIQKALEVSIPENIEIKVVEETPETVYLVLPVNPASVGTVKESGELAPQTMGY
jgi:hypothetical protein